MCFSLIVIKKYTWTTVHLVDNYTLYSLRHPLYPVGRLNEAQGNYTVDISDQPKQVLGLLDFMNYTEYLNFNESFKLPINTTKVINTVEHMRVRRIRR